MIEDLLLPLVCERFKTDERYRQGHVAIIAATEGTVIMGVHTPDMKRLAKQLAARKDWPELLDAFGKASHLSHEERMVWGLLLDYVPCPLERRLAYIDAFLPVIDNWAICDNFCCNAKWALKADKGVDFAAYKEALWRYLVRLSHSQEAFTVRVMLIMSMCYYLGDSDYMRTFEQLSSLHLHENEPYYKRMGVAWLLATALAKHPDATRAYVRQASLPNDIVKLYVRKARESRITKEVPAL